MKCTPGACVELSGVSTRDTYSKAIKVTTTQFHGLYFWIMMHGACEYEENNSTRYRAQYTNCCMSIARILHVTCTEYVVVTTRFQWRIAFTVYAQPATSMCTGPQA